MIKSIKFKGSAGAWFSISLTISILSTLENQSLAYESLNVLRSDSPAIYGQGLGLHARTDAVKVSRGKRTKQHSRRFLSAKNDAPKPPETVPFDPDDRAIESATTLTVPGGPGDNGDWIRGGGAVGDTSSGDVETIEGEPNGSGFYKQQELRAPGDGVLQKANPQAAPSDVNAWQKWMQSTANTGLPANAPSAVQGAPGTMYAPWAGQGSPPPSMNTGWPSPPTSAVQPPPGSWPPPPYSNQFAPVQPQYGGPWTDRGAGQWDQPAQPIPPTATDAPANSNPDPLAALTNSAGGLITGLMGWMGSLQKNQPVQSQTAAPPAPLPNFNMQEAANSPVGQWLTNSVGSMMQSQGTTNFSAPPPQPSYRPTQPNRNSELFESPLGRQLLSERSGERPVSGFTPTQIGTPLGPTSLLNAALSSSSNRTVLNYWLNKGMKGAGIRVTLQ